MRKLFLVFIVLGLLSACGGQKAAETEELTEEEQTQLVDSIADETNVRIDSLSDKVDEISNEVDSLLNTVNQ